MEFGPKYNIENKNSKSLELPKVTLEENPTKLQKMANGSLRSMNFNIKTEQEFVGDFTLNTVGRSENDGYGYIQTIRLEDNYRGKDKNYSKSAYVQIINHLKKEGKVLRNEWTLSKGADKVWQWLIEHGYAQIIEEGERNEENKAAGYSTYRYESII